jgi:hypothetical protein
VVVVAEASFASSPQSLAHSRALWNVLRIGFGLLDLGIVARRRGDYVAATAYVVESLAPWRRVGNDRGVAHALEELAVIAAACGEAMGAARLAGAASALREAIAMPRPPRQQADLDGGLAPAKAALGEAAFAAAWQAGRDLPVDDALDEGRSLADAVKVGGGASNGASFSIDDALHSARSR